MYTDPSGEIFWLVPLLIGGALFGTGNLVAHAIKGDIKSFGDAFKYFGQGFLAGATLAAAWQFAPLIPGIGQAIQTGMNIYGSVQLGGTALSAVGGLVRGISSGDWSTLGNAGKIFLGNFYLDENRSFLGAAWQGVSRHTWEFLQTGLGHSVAQFSNTIGKVTDVNFWGGATFSHTDYEGGSLALGNNILLSNSDPETNITAGPDGYTTMHEYGHYLQSQRNGLSYLFKFGIPSSFKNRNWTELDANLRASKYFNKHYGFNWNPNYYTGHRAKYSNLSNRVRNTKWWEWPIFPLSFIWN